MKDKFGNVCVRVSVLLLVVLSLGIFVPHASALWKAARWNYNAADLKNDDCIQVAIDEFDAKLDLCPLAQGSTAAPSNATTALKTKVSVAKLTGTATNWQDFIFTAPYACTVSEVYVTTDLASSVSVAGATNLDGITDWKVGDWAMFNGTAWEKIDNTDQVTSVNGLQGAVSIGLPSVLGQDNTTGAHNISLL